MAGDLGGGGDEGSHIPSELVGRGEFMTAIKGIMELLQGITRGGDCSAPSPQTPPSGSQGVLAQGGSGEIAPGGRPGKEPMTESGERDLAGRVLFPSPGSGVSLGAGVAQVELAKPASGGSPFSELIISAPIPEGFKEPSMTFYTGKDDPVQHLQWFEDTVSIRPMTDAFKCRLFAITLKDKARDWFHQLPVGSIYSFEDLSRSFQLRFSTSKKRKKSAESIFLIKQRHEETLAQYVDRFQEEVLNIQEVPGYALQMAFTVGLRESLFKMRLTRKAPLSFEELMEKAAKEIATEAANPGLAKKLAKLVEAEPREQGSLRQQEGRRREEQRGQGYQGPQGGQEQGRGFAQGGGNFYGGQGRPNPPPWRQAPRQLLPPPAQAMAIRRGGGVEARDIPARRRKGGRAVLYCDYHQAEGHATTTCPEFLEVREARGQTQQQPPVRIEEVPPGAVVDDDLCEDRTDVGAKGRIAVIHGGVGIEATRKASLHTVYRRSVASTSQDPPPQEKVTFSSKDMPDHEDPFCDALVIQAAIEGYTVSRILVDNGSSVNVIFKKAFDELKVEARRVLASDGPLFGFSGERKEVEGGVGLQVTIGGGSRNCRFVIVDAPSSYNAIFGRPLISAFRCVPSSFHQCLKFNAGGIQVRIRGDPRMARQCYVTAVNNISWQAGAEEMEKIMERRSERGVAGEAEE